MTAHMILPAIPPAIATLHGPTEMPRDLKDNYVIKCCSTACSTYYSIRVGLSELRVFEFQCSSKSTHSIQEPYESTYQ